MFDFLSLFIICENINIYSMGWWLGTLYPCSQNFQPLRQMCVFITPQIIKCWRKVNVRFDTYIDVFSTIGQLAVLRTYMHTPTAFQGQAALVGRSHRSYACQQASHGSCTS